MLITYFMRRSGRFFEVWDSTADWVDTFDTEADALACIAFLEAQDARLRGRK